jgi:hypothetical protein
VKAVAASGSGSGGDGGSAIAGNKKQASSIGEAAGGGARNGTSGVDGSDGGSGGDGSAKSKFRKAGKTISRLRSANMAVVCIG